MRNRNVTPNGFEYQIDEWEYLDGAHTREKVAYLAMEEGPEVIGGREFEAGIINEVDHNWTSVRFKNDNFDGQQTVICQQATSNGAQATCIRIRRVTATGFQVRLYEEEATSNGRHAKEKVHFIAIGRGEGSEDGVNFQSETMSRVNSNWRYATVSGDFIT